MCSHHSTLHIVQGTGTCAAITVHHTSCKGQGHVQPSQYTTHRARDRDMCSCHSTPHTVQGIGSCEASQYTTHHAKDMDMCSHHSTLYIMVDIRHSLICHVLECLHVNSEQFKHKSQFNTSQTILSAYSKQQPPIIYVRSIFHTLKYVHIS
jgi:hypothetical protein